MNNIYNSTLGGSDEHSAITMERLMRPLWHAQDYLRRLFVDAR